jgi:hypothetical protein
MVSNQEYPKGLSQEHVFSVMSLHVLTFLYIYLDLHVSIYIFFFYIYIWTFCVHIFFHNLKQDSLCKIQKVLWKYKINIDLPVSEGS